MATATAMATAGVCTCSTRPNWTERAGPSEGDAPIRGAAPVPTGRSVPIDTADQKQVQTFGLTRLSISPFADAWSEVLAVPTSLFKRFSSVSGPPMRSYSNLHPASGRSPSPSPPRPPRARSSPGREAMGVPVGVVRRVSSRREVERVPSTRAQLSSHRSPIKDIRLVLSTVRTYVGEFTICKWEL
jgi:hypothetical protein